MQHDDHDDEGNHPLGPALAAQETDGDPEQVLLSAAKAARDLLPQLERKLLQLQTQIELLRPIAAYGTQHHTISVPSIWKAVEGERFRKRFRVQLNADALEAESSSDARQITMDIDLVLSQCKPMKVKDLQTTIKDLCEHSWGESTLYAYLSKGKKDGKYTNENGLWSLTAPLKEEKLW